MLKLLHNSLQRMSLTQTSSLSSELFFHVAPCCYFIITFLSHTSSTTKGMAVSVISPLESRLKYLSNNWILKLTDWRQKTKIIMVPKWCHTHFGDISSFLQSMVIALNLLWLWLYIFFSCRGNGMDWKLQLQFSGVLCCMPFITLFILFTCHFSSIKKHVQRISC